MGGRVKRKVKDKYMRVRSLEDAWNLYGTTLTKVQTECIPHARKGTAKSTNKITLPPNATNASVTVPQK